MAAFFAVFFALPALFAAVFALPAPVRFAAFFALPALSAAFLAGFLPGAALPFAGVLLSLPPDSPDPPGP
ncbi:hypothetical protein [Streptomyces sp. DW26H14]|uniref:hypothetical protein n=1 Tax=Streptomyces sp. DW26H14 TaxID=3435395 RepID=UPI00403DBC32